MVVLFTTLPAPWPVHMGGYCPQPFSDCHTFSRSSYLLGCTQVDPVLTPHLLPASLCVSPAFPKPESRKAFLDLSPIPFCLFPAETLKLGFPFPPLLNVPLKDMPHLHIGKRILFCLFPGSFCHDCNSPYWETQDPWLSWYCHPSLSSTPLAIFVFSPFYPPPPAFCGSYLLVKVSG